MLQAERRMSVVQFQMIWDLDLQEGGAYMSGYHKRNPEPFPVHTLKRVDRPTTIIDDDKVQRVSQCD